MQLAPLFTFLAGLKAHNDRAWFQENKPTYDQLRADFEQDVAYWAQQLGKLDPALAGQDGRRNTFRIYRDVRFSKNKDPYKTHFSAYFTASGSKDIDAPGYYVQLGPSGQTLIAGGLYQPDKAQLAAVRQEIDYNGPDLHRLLAAPAFRQYFGPLGGDKLKKAPADYPSTHPDIELLKHKSYVAAHELSDAQALANKDFRAYVLDVCQALVPLSQFLRQAL